MSNAQKVSAERLAGMLTDLRNHGGSTLATIYVEPYVSALTELQALRAAPTPDAHSEVGVERYPLDEKLAAVRAYVAVNKTCRPAAMEAALQAAAAVRDAGVVKADPVAFQDRVAAAHVPLFHDDPTDLAERRDRFYEEATETVQALGMTADDAHALVEYTFGRAPGDVRKEIGAAALTLASLCVVGGWDLMECAEGDLAALQTPEKIAKVRAKRATRHGRGPLPGLTAALASKPEGER